MSELTLQIGGRSYTVACADGEESHVSMLGGLIDEKFTAMGNSKSPQEVQNFLFAALILADELHEARKSSDVPSIASSDNQEQLGAEIAELRRAQDSLTQERDALAEELKLAKASATSGADNAAGEDQQHDLFSGELVATRLEALASQAESFAEALEGSV
ncbi:MAG: cell division protein ZapA [Erythrobacter sp.]